MRLLEADFRAQTRRTRRTSLREGEEITAIRTMAVLKAAPTVANKGLLSCKEAPKIMGCTCLQCLSRLQSKIDKERAITQRPRLEPVQVLRGVPRRDRFQVSPARVVQELELAALELHRQQMDPQTPTVSSISRAKEAGPEIIPSVIRMQMLSLITQIESSRIKHKALTYQMTSEIPKR